MAARFDASAMDKVIGYRLRRAQAYVFAQFAERFARLELRPAEYSVLELIADNPGCQQGTLAAALGIKRANFVGLIRGLDVRGLTARGQQPGDKRANALYLTPAGQATIVEARTIQEEFERHCVELLGGEAERDQLLTLLDRLAPKEG